MPEPDAARSRWQQRFDQAAQSQAAQSQSQAAQRDADFTTLSGLEVDPVYGPPDVDQRIGWPGEFPFTAACTPPATAASRGRSASSPASATPGRPTSGTRCCCGPGAPGCRWPLTCRP